MTEKNVPFALSVFAARFGSEEIVMIALIDIARGVAYEVVVRTNNVVPTGIYSDKRVEVTVVIFPAGAVSDEGVGIAVVFIAGIITEKGIVGTIAGSSGALALNSILLISAPCVSCEHTQ